MKSHVLFSWLDRLSISELEEFQAYIQLGSVQGNRFEVEILEMVMGLKREGKQVNSIAGIKEQVWPDKQISLGYWNKICSGLMSRLREYLAWRSWREKKHSIPLSLARFANENHWDEEFMKIYNRGWKVLQEGLGKDSTYYRRMAEFLNEKAIYDYRISRTADPTPIINVIKELDTAYWLEKIKFAASVRNHEKVFRGSFGLEDISTLLTSIEEQYASFPLVGKLYFHAFQSMDIVEGESHYQQLKDLLYQNTINISPDDTWDLNTYLINFCARQIRQGNDFYRPELNALFELILEQGVFSNKGNINPWLYKNVIVSTLRLGQLEWAREFSNRYESALLNDFQDNTKNFCRAAIAYSAGDFPTSHALLAKVLQEYQDHFFGVEGRLLYWRCNIEMGDAMHLTYLADAYIKFFYRHPLLEPEYKSSVITFMRLSLRYTVAAQLEPNSRNKAFKKILKRLEKEEQIDLLAWLLKKIKTGIK